MSDKKITFNNFSEVSSFFKNEPKFLNFLQGIKEGRRTDVKLEGKYYNDSHAAALAYVLQDPKLQVTKIVFRYTAMSDFSLKELRSALKANHNIAIINVSDNLGMTQEAINSLQTIIIDPRSHLDNFISLNPKRRAVSEFCNKNFKSIIELITKIQNNSTSEQDAQRIMAAKPIIKEAIYLLSDLNSRRKAERSNAVPSIENLNLFEAVKERARIAGVTVTKMVEDFSAPLVQSSTPVVEHPIVEQPAQTFQNTPWSNPKQDTAISNKPKSKRITFKNFQEITHCFSEDPGFIEFLAEIKDGKRKRVKFSGPSYDDNQASAMAFVLQCPNARITEISFSNTSVGDFGLERVLDALKVKHTVAILSLKNNPDISRAALQHVEDVVTDRRLNLDNFIFVHPPFRNMTVQCNKNLQAIIALIAKAQSGNVSPKDAAKLTTMRPIIWEALTILSDPMAAAKADQHECPVPSRQTLEYFNVIKEWEKEMGVSIAKSLEPYGKPVPMVNQPQGHHTNALNSSRNAGQPGENRYSR